MRLQGRVAVVTGGARGIGAGIARAFADAGATVVGTATSESGAAAISERLGDAGRGIVLNIGDDESVQACIKDIQGSEGAPTIVVNNAGITRDNLLMSMKAHTEAMRAIAVTWAVRWTELMGLVRNTSPPASSASDNTWSTAFPVTNMIGVHRPPSILRISRAASTPFCPGISWSRMTMS